MNISGNSEWFALVIMGLGVILFFTITIGLIFWVKPPLHELSRNQQPIYVFNTEPINLQIGRLELNVPKNYVRKTKKNTQGHLKEITLHALAPNMEGYQKDNWWLFEDKSPEARMILIRFAHMKGVISEQLRFHHLYSQKLEQNSKSSTPPGLKHYFYKDRNRRNQDVFTGFDRYKRRLIYFCFRPSKISIAPHCSRTFPVALDTSLTYRFKRTHLGNWKEIDSRIQDFIGQINKLAMLRSETNFRN